MEQDDFQDTADVTMQHIANPLAPNKKGVEVRTVTHGREERMAADHDGTLGRRIPKEDVSRKCL
jgi:hypothetical protein